MTKATELTQVLRRLPIGETFIIDIRPVKPSTEYPNILGHIQRNRQGFAFVEDEPTGPPEITVAKRPVTSSKAQTKGKKK